MADLVFASYAVVALLGIAVCAHHAYPDRDRLAFLGTGIVYGVLLEQLVIVQFDAYTYNVEDFYLVAFDVPVAIGFGWAAIIYAGFEIGKRFDLSGGLPAFVALFALHIDLAIDAVAIRVPFWNWTDPGIWFGVPLGNFVGWFLVASLFPACWLLLRDHMTFRPLLGLGAIAGAVLGLIVLLEIWEAVATTFPLRVAILGGAILVAFVVVLHDGPRLAQVDPRLAAVAVLYHGYFFALLLGLGMYEEQPLMVVASLAMIAISVAVHGTGVFERAGSRHPA